MINDGHDVDDVCEENKWLRLDFTCFLGMIIEIELKSISEWLKVAYSLSCDLMAV